MPLPAELQGGNNGSSILRNPTNLNIIVGRNGSGKSRFLRALYGRRNQNGSYFSYVSPERAGIFEPSPNIEQNTRSNMSWLDNHRDKNQVESFKNSSANKLRELAFLFGKKLEYDRALRADFSKTFDSEQLSKINGLLSNVHIDRSDQIGGDFVFSTLDGANVKPDQISSGESEAISLGAEILHFFSVLKPDRTNVLLLDEPDVHMHPDLQARLARFIVNEISALTPELREKTIVCLATHSTPLICELAISQYCSIGTKVFGVDIVEQRPVAEELKKAAAFFGHPLSKSISDDVPVILEGEDDERIWQQAARTGQGRLKIFPVLAFSVNQQGDLETFCNSMLAAIYDHPVALSIRDGDGRRGSLASVGCVERYRLQCYAAENLLVTDEVLSSLGTSWSAFQVAAQKWCAENITHPDIQFIQRLAGSTDRLRDEKIKDIRTLIPVIAGSKKPWEVHVGQVLGRVSDLNTDRRLQHGIAEYVGIEFLKRLGLLT